MESFDALNNRINNHKLKEVELTDSIRQKEALISAMKLVEERTATLTAIIDSSDDAIISKDLNSIITSWNISAERIFGYTAEEMIGQSILKLIPADRHGEETMILSQLKMGNRVNHFETKRLTKQGILIDVSLTISPVKDKAGNIIGLSKIARDITYKKLEEQRKNDFIAIVSHELKTPLTSVRSYIQLALAKIKNQKEGFIEDVLRRANAQTQKMSMMINDFLNLSRLEEGKMVLNKSKFSLSDLINEVVGEGALFAPTHIIECQCQSNLIVYADRDKLFQVMNNLLSNAIKYANQGTTINIYCTIENDRVIVSFADRGMGISAEDQKYLFERFYRVSGEQLTNISGFGIGLYLVAEILKLHETEIRVQSKLGEGAVFSFALPFELA
jgi:two-component system sensor histidine kinase VicK